MAVVTRLASDKEGPDYRRALATALAAVVMAIEPSSQTRSEIVQRSQDFAYNARESDFLKEAHATGMEPKEIEIQREGGVIPGLGNVGTVPTTPGHNAP